MVAKATVPLTGHTYWGKNIRNEMGRARWGKLRKVILAEQDNECACCGSKNKSQCHEVWEFNDEKGVQTLKAFQATCSLCYLGSYFGLAQKLASQGHAYIDNIVGQFLKVNGISVEQFRELLSEAVTIFEKRCEIEWSQDFADYTSLL